MLRVYERDVTALKDLLFSDLDRFAEELVFARRNRAMLQGVIDSRERATHEPG